MSDIVQYRPSSAMQRRVQKELVNISADTGLAQARTQARAEVEAARIAAIGELGQRAMQEVAMLSKIENEMVAAAPSAQARLLHLGEITTLAIGGIIMNATRRI